MASFDDDVIGCDVVEEYRWFVVLQDDEEKYDVLNESTKLNP